MNNRMLKNKTTKTILLASLVAIIVIPVAVTAFEQKDLSVEEELAMIQPHVDTLYDANMKLNEKYKELEVINSSAALTSNSEKDSIENKISTLEAVIQNKTQILIDIENKLKEKYALKSDFESVYADARAMYRTIPKDIDTAYLGFGLGDDRKSLEVIINTAKFTDTKNKTFYEGEVRETFRELPIKVQIRYNSIENVNPDEGCSLQTANCDPLVGGIQIEGEWAGKCTMGLPIYRDDIEGYITAGHCVGNGYYKIGTDEDVYQPLNGGKIGEAVTLIYTKKCDCAFVEHTSSEGTQEEIWYSSNYYISVTSYTDRVSNGALVMMTGAESGSKVGIVDEQYRTITSGSIDFDVVELTTNISNEGDSGAPVSSLAKSNFYGIHKGFNPDTGNSIFIPWENIESELGL